MLEKRIERHLVDGCKKRGWLCYKFVSPGQSGVPDRMIVIPPCGRVAFVELKQPSGRVAPLQEIQGGRLRAAGCRVYVAWNTDGVGQVLDDLERWASQPPTHAGGKGDGV